MAQFDKRGREYAQLENLSVGDLVEADTGFSCLAAGMHKVYGDEHGLFIYCRGPKDQLYVEPYHHYLDGQDDGDGYLIGIYPKR